MNDYQKNEKNFVGFSGYFGIKFISNNSFIIKK